MELMVDLETLGTSPTSAIIEIGWCSFDLEAPEFIPGGFCGSILIDPESCVASGLQIEWSTIQWWMGQSDEARTRFTRLQGMSLEDGLRSFLTIFDAGFTGVWSHGASFDIPILDNAFRAVGLKVPWGHRVVRDTRTLFAISPPVWPDNPVKHSAMHDAVAQAWAVHSSWRKLHP